MKLSVVTVCLNSRDTIAEAVQSIHAQTHGEVEHIVVDGGSDDGTLAILEEHRAGISTLISEPDPGLYFAMNKGIEAATGDYVGFLNSDDVYHHDHVLERVADALVGGRPGLLDRRIAGQQIRPACLALAVRRGGVNRAFRTRVAPGDVVGQLHPELVRLLAEFEARPVR